MRNLFVFVVLTYVLVSACTKDYETISTIEDTATIAEGTYPNVAEELWVYFARFEKEAAERGQTIDLNSLNLTAAIEELHPDDVAGVCNYNSRNPNHIGIDQTFWNRAASRWREMVVFHELGHCVLGRGHREDNFDNNLCVSIMRSGTGTCRDAYQSSTRDYYLDELFDETIVP
ncbi:MAG: hypothetical protein R3E32_06445 [Chitinophagales bacterium]